MLLLLLTSFTVKPPLAEIWTWEVFDTYYWENTKGSESGFDMGLNTGGIKVNQDTSILVNLIRALEISHIGANPSEREHFLLLHKEV